MPEPKDLAQVERDRSHPGKRHAFAAAAMSDGFFVFGGNRHVKGGKPLNFEDLWKFSIATNSWVEVRPVGRLPGTRGHHSLLALSPHWLLLYGGALCNPGCKCYGDSWILGTGEAAAPGGPAWRQLNASDAPIHRYRQSLVLAPPSDASVDPQLRELYLFGGESYKPYMYHNAVNRLQLRLPSSADGILSADATPPVAPPHGAAVGGTAAAAGRAAARSGGNAGGHAAAHGAGGAAHHKHAEPLEVAPRAAYRAALVKPLAAPPMEILPAAEHEMRGAPLIALLVCTGLVLARYVRMRMRRRRSVQVPE